MASIVHTPWSFCLPWKQATGFSEFACFDLMHRRSHIDIWGGCCGTWDKHLDLIAKEVKHVIAACEHG
jgi:S-methylmethionine-dependent homocysteine/selenocysteine methylase